MQESVSEHHPAHPARYTQPSLPSPALLRPTRRKNEFSKRAAGTARRDAAAPARPAAADQKRPTTGIDDTNADARALRPAAWATGPVLRIAHRDESQPLSLV